MYISSSRLQVSPSLRTETYLGKSHPLSRRIVNYIPYIPAVQGQYYIIKPQLLYTRWKKVTILQGKKKIYYPNVNVVFT